MLTRVIQSVLAAGVILLSSPSLAQELEGRNDPRRQGASASRLGQ